jgi:hypothetical protein
VPCLYSIGNDAFWALKLRGRAILAISSTPVGEEKGEEPQHNYQIGGSSSKRAMEKCVEVGDEILS